MRDVKIAQQKQSSDPFAFAIFKRRLSGMVEIPGDDFAAAPLWVLEAARDNPVMIYDDGAPCAVMLPVALYDRMKRDADEGAKQRNADA